MTHALLPSKLQHRHTPDIARACTACLCNYKDCCYRIKRLLHAVLGARSHPTSKVTSLGSYFDHKPLCTGALCPSRDDLM